MPLFAEVVGRVGVLRLRDCFAFAKQALRSG
jgi:hypothetical protein